MTNENKLRLSGLFVSLLIIIFTVAYSIYQEKTLSHLFFVSVVIFSMIIGVSISKIKNPKFSAIFIQALEIFLPKDIDTLGKMVENRESKNILVDNYIRQRPILKFTIVSLIVILVIVFVVVFLSQFINLIN